MRSILCVEQKDLEEDQETICLNKKDALTRELESERARAKKLLDKIMQHWGIPDAYTEMRKGSWRDRGPLETMGSISF
jgi:AmiR/NasT family two-component response regulator